MQEQRFTMLDVRQFGQRRLSLALFSLSVDSQSLERLCRDGRRWLRPVDERFHNPSEEYRHSHTTVASSHPNVECLCYSSIQGIVANSQDLYIIITTTVE